MGGLSRKAFQIKALRKKNRPVLAVDAGALFFPLRPNGPPEPLRATAQGIARAMALMKMDAIGIAPSDLWAGAAFLSELARRHHLPLVSMNLLDADGRAGLFPAYVLVRAGDLRVAILGITGRGDLPAEKRSDFRITPWQDHLPGVMDEVRAKSDLIILLSSAGQEENQDMARRFRDLHVIIQAGQGPGNLVPVNIDNTLLCRTASRGKYIGLLEIDWNISGTWGENRSERLRSEQSRLDRVDWRIGRLKKRYSPKELENKPQYRRLLQTREKIRQTMQRLLEEERRSPPSCRYRSRFVALRASLPPDSRVQAIVDETRKRVNAINRAERRAEGKSIPGLASLLAGSEKCGSCHESQLRNHLSSRHARAYTTLVEHDQEYNEQCLPCHVTLPTYEPDGVKALGPLAGIDRLLRGVGCESCHGPGAGHAADPDDTGKRPRLPNEAACRRCHTPERDPGFDFPAKRARLHCPA